MKRITILIVGVLFFASCQSKDNDNTDELLLLTLANQRPASPGSNPAPKVTFPSPKTVTLDWEPVEGAIVYNLYYTASPSSPGLDGNGNFLPIEDAPDPVVVPSSQDGIIRIRNVEPPYTISGLKLGIPYKFRYTVVTKEGESAPSEIARIEEVLPTQKARLTGIWMVGGLSAGYVSTIAALDFYDVDNGVWYPNVTSIPTPVSFAGIGTGLKKIVIAGGFTSSGAVSGITQIYNVLTDSWSQGTAGPASNRANIGTASFAGKVYFLGGTTTAANAAWGGSPATDVYDIANDSWTTMVAFGTAGSERAVTEINGILYNNGGRTAAATLATTHDGIIVPLNLLTTGPVEVVLSSARGHSLVGYQNSTISEMWTIGGVTTITGNTVSGVGASALTAYTPSNLVQTLPNPFAAPAAWVAPPAIQLSLAAGYGSAVVDPRNGNVYYTGGNSSSATPTSPIGNTTFIRTNFVTKEAWTELSSLPIGRWGHTAVIVK